MLPGELWFPCPLDYWPLLLAALPRPLPIEAVYADLRWWQHQEARDLQRRPGRPALVRRWGITDYAAKAALQAEAVWGDPEGIAKIADTRRSTSGAPEIHQPAASRDTGEPMKRGKKRQRVTSDPPAVRPTRVYTDTETGTETENTHDGAPDGAPVPAWARSAARKGATPEQLVEACSGVLSVIKGRAYGVPSAPSVKPILALWRALEHQALDAFERDLSLVAAAARDCPHPIFAHDLRAVGWAGGKDRSTDTAAICRQAPGPGSQGATYPERLEVAREWDAAGRPASDWPVAAAPAGQRAPEAEARRGWAYMIGLCRDHGRQRMPAVWHSDPVKDRRLRAATEAVGGIGRLFEVQLDRVEVPWRRAYEAAP